MFRKICVYLICLVLCLVPILAQSESQNINKQPELTIQYTMIFEYNGEKMVMEPWPDAAVTYDVPNRIIYVSHIVPDAYVGIDEATKLMLKDNKKKITFSFNSPGGDTDSMSIIMLQLDTLKAKGIEVDTEVTKNHSCMSACTLIFLKGDKRRASHESVFMIHSPYFLNKDAKGIEAKNIFLEAELDYLRGIFIDEFTKVCGKGTPLNTDITDKKDHFYISRKLQETCPAYITELTDGSLVNSKGF